MGHRVVDLSWQFREDDELLHRDIDETPENPHFSRRPSRRTWIFISAVSLFALLTVALQVTFSHQIAARDAALRNSVAKTVQAEAWIWYSGTWDALPALVDPQARRSWAIWYRNYDEGSRNWAGDFAQVPIVSVEEIELLAPDIALVSVRYVQGKVPDKVVQRESRFYRLVDGEWLRTAPQVELWGEPQILETKNFRLEYRSRDQATVDEIARQVDEVYAHMRQVLGLPVQEGDNGANTQKLVVQIVPDNAGVNPGTFIARKMRMPAPELMLAPEEYTNADIVLEQIAHGLADRVVDEYVAGRTIDPNWRAIEQGVRRWLAADAIRRVGASSMPATGAFVAYAASHGFPSLENLCCCRKQSRDDNRKADEELRSAEKQCVDHYSRWLWISDWVNQAGESVVAHGMNQYGRDRLPVLLDELTRPHTPEQLIAAVFSTSAMEFEAEWRSRTMADLELDSDQRTVRYRTR